MSYYAPGRFHDRLLYGMTLPFQANIAGIQENDFAGSTVNVYKDGRVQLSDFCTER